MLPPQTLTVFTKLPNSLRYSWSTERYRRTIFSSYVNREKNDEKIDSKPQKEDDLSEDFIEVGVLEPKYTNVNSKKSLLDTIQDDVKQTLKFLKNPSRETWNKSFISNHYDVAIFGAGAIGSTLANIIKERYFNDVQVIVIDGDLSPDKFSKHEEPHIVAPRLTLGHLTQQFSLKENIMLAKSSVDYFRNLELHLNVFDDDPPIVSYRPFGHLNLATDKGYMMLKENHIQQAKHGIRTELATTYQLSQRFPWLNLDDISLGCMGSLNEGLIDPGEYMLAIRSAAMRRGVLFMEAVPLEFHFNTSSSEITGFAPGTYQSPHSIVVKESNGNLREIDFGMAIIALGSETGKFTKDFLHLKKENKAMYKLEIPISRKKHYVFCFESELPGPGISSPLINDPSGVYFRREGFTNQYVCGCTLPIEDSSADDLHVDSKIFYDYIWPVLVHRVPVFEKLQLKSGWAYFEDHNSFDGSPIISRLPTYLNVIIAAGFSRHGVMLAPAVAKAVSEMLFDGYFVTNNLTRFGYNRIAQDEPLVEPLII